MNTAVWYAGRRIDDALRDYLGRTVIGDSADATTAALRAFADVYAAQNPSGPLADAGVAYAVALDIMRLNIEPTPLDDFLHTVAQSLGSIDLGDGVVEHIYRTTRSAPLHAATDDGGCCIA